MRGRNELVVLDAMIIEEIAPSDLQLIPKYIFLYAMFVTFQDTRKALIYKCFFKKFTVFRKI